MDEYSLQISSLNTRGLGNGEKRVAIFKWLKNITPGIHFLQETHSLEKYENKWESEWDGDIKFCHGEWNARGVAILINKNIDIKYLNVEKDTSGWFILVKCCINEKPFTLINVYCPTKDKEKEQLDFLKFVEEMIESYGVQR